MCDSKLTALEDEAVGYLREWAASGGPKRVDGSFPTDVLTAFRRIARVPDSVSGRRLEDMLTAFPDADYVLGRRHLG